MTVRQLTPSQSVPHLGANELYRLVTPAAAADAITSALRGGIQPERDPARSSVPLDRGEFLLMPSQSSTAAGIKVVTVAPDNPAQGLPRVQGIYLLFDAATLTPVAVLDGAALTALRTPAVPAALLRALRERFAEPVRLVVFGGGPQGLAHVSAIQSLEDITLTDVVIVDAAPDRVSVPQDLTEAPARVLRAHDPAVREAVAVADVVVCATTARRPVFDSADLRQGATVIAIGSHEPDARELDGALMARAVVVVEDIATALREAGDVVMAVAEGHLTEDRLVTLADVVRGEHAITAEATVVLKTTGMAWQDLVVAEAAVRRWLT
jgi:ornithine cyclodeaminase